MMGNLSKYSRHRSRSHPRAIVPVVYRDDADADSAPSWNVAVRWADTGDFHIRCFNTFAEAVHDASVCRTVNHSLGGTV